MSRCFIQDCPAPAFVLYVCNPSGHSVPLCQRHLDMWLDNADDDPYMEPAELIWLGRQRWLSVA